jgi:hypothetical protein
MANVQSMSNSFKGELLTGTHVFGPGGDTFKAALYLSTASLGAATTAYSATGEVSGTNYTAGGVTVTFGTAPAVANGVAYVTPSANIVFSNVTLSTAFDTVLIYNSTKTNKAVSVHTFGSQIVTAGTFTLTMPTNNDTTGLLRLS